MNYLEAINQFWKLRRSKRITNLQADLYYFILQESNSRGVGNNWENPFQCSNGLVCTSIGITEKSLIDARNVLQQLGLIDFEKGITKRKSPTYYLLEYWNNVSNPVSNRGGKRGGNPVSNRGGNPVNIYKGLNETETKPNETSKSHSGGKPPAPKKKDAYSKVPYWKKFVSTWDEFYKIKTGEKHIYQKKDFGCLKKLYDFLKRRAESKNFEWNEKTAIDGFRMYLEKAYQKDGWLRENFSIPNILSQFNQIVNGQTNSKKATGGGVNTASAFAKIDAMYNSSGESF